MVNSYPLEPMKSFEFKVFDDNDVDMAELDTSPIILRASFIAWYIRMVSSRFCAVSIDSSIRSICGKRLRYLRDQTWRNNNESKQKFEQLEHVKTYRISSSIQ